MTDNKTPSDLPPLPPAPPVLNNVHASSVSSQNIPANTLQDGERKRHKSNLTDEQLMKKARYAGRDLSILATLPTIAIIAVIVVSFFIKNLPAELLSVMGGMSVAMLLIAAGYWTLAVSARRGNSNAVGVVLVIMTVQIALSLITSGIIAATNSATYQPNFPGLILPGLIIVALANDRKFLLELKARGLWDQVFGSAKSSSRLCLIGGIILAIGFLCINVNMMYVASKVNHANLVESRQADAFVRINNTEEKDFLVAMHGLRGAYGKVEIDAALAKVNVLEQKVIALEQEAANTKNLLAILNVYKNAVRQWKNALILLQEPNADVGKAQKMLQLGDKLNNEACQQFNKRYVKP